jgi:hypothetical protein
MLKSSIPSDRQRFWQFACSQRMKEQEATENVETRLITDGGFLGHTMQYGQMHCLFRSGVAGTNFDSDGCGLGWPRIER